MNTASTCLEKAAKEYAFDIFGANVTRVDFLDNGIPPWLHIRAKLEGELKDGFISLVIPRVESEALIQKVASELGMGSDQRNDFLIACLGEYLNTIAGAVMVCEEVTSVFGKTMICPPYSMLKDLPDMSEPTILSLTFKGENGNPIYISIHDEEG